MIDIDYNFYDDLAEKFLAQSKTLESVTSQTLYVRMHVEVLGVSEQFAENNTGKYVVELANKLKDENVRIIIAANNSVKSDLPANCLLLGKISDSKKLSHLYSISDITLITSKRETFSMPTAESLCCGTAVVGFEAGGPESIAIKEFSDFVEYGDAESLYLTIKKRLDTNYDKLQISSQAQKIYSRTEMLKGYLNLYLEKE